MIDEASTPSDKPSWLDWLDKTIEEEVGDYFGDPLPYQIVRELLQAPDGDNGAINKVVEIFVQDYVAGFSGNKAEAKKPPEYDAGVYLNALSLAVLGVVNRIVFTDSKHDTLAAFITTLKRSAAFEFDLKNPEFVFYEWGLGAAAAEEWNANRVTHWTKDHEFLTAREQAERWLSLAAFLAKLYRDGVLTGDGLLWLTGDFRDAFEKNVEADVSVNIGRQGEVLATANHILIAGEKLVSEVKNPSEKRWFQFDKETWTFWASKLQEVSDAVTEDAPWELKARAQQAHDKMVELYPEAFEDEATLAGTA